MLLRFALAAFALVLLAGLCNAATPSPPSSTTTTCTSSYFSSPSGGLCSSGTVYACDVPGSISVVSGVVQYLSSITASYLENIGEQSCRLIDSQSTPTAQWTTSGVNIACNYGYYNYCDSGSCGATTFPQTTAVTPTTCCCSSLNSIASQWCSSITTANQLSSSSSSATFLPYQSIPGFPPVTSCSTSSYCVACSSSGSSSDGDGSGIAVFFMSATHIIEIAAGGAGFILLCIILITVVCIKCQRKLSIAGMKRRQAGQIPAIQIAPHPPQGPPPLKNDAAIIIAPQPQGASLNNFSSPPPFDPNRSHVRCNDLSPLVNSSIRMTVHVVSSDNTRCGLTSLRVNVNGPSSAEANTRILQVPTATQDGIVEISLTRAGRHNVTIVDPVSNVNIGGSVLLDVVVPNPDRAVWRVGNDGTDLQESTNMDLPPIFGVGTMPLVSLRQAVSRLVDLVPEINEQAEFAIRVYTSGAAEIPHGLHPEVAAAVRLYTMEYATPELSLYYMLNKALRSADRTVVQPYFSYMRLLQEAFTKMPKWDPTKSLWRGMKGDFRPAFSIGTTIPWWGYMSTTRSIEAAQAFLGTGPRTLFNINGVEEGVPVEGFSAFKGEAEVLLPPGLQMEVMSMADMGSEFYMVQLTVSATKGRLVS